MKNLNKKDLPIPDKNIKKVSKIETKKKKYIPPTINIITIELESGIAAGSSTITPIGPHNEEYPEVYEWINEGDQKNEFEL